MRTERTTQKIVRVVHVRYPIAQCFVDCVLQRARAGIHGNNFSSEQPHSENIECLASHVFRAHVDYALQAKHRADRGRRDAMLTRARFGNDSVFAHPPREQGLPYRVVGLVRASVQKIFPFQVNLCSARVRSQSLRVKQRRWPTTVIAQELFKLVPEIGVASCARELFRQFIQRRDQSFRNVATAKLSPMTILVGLARGDCRSLHMRLLCWPSDYQMLGRSRGRDELFDCAMIFHAWRGFNAGTNVNGVWPDSCDGVADVLRIQTAR